LFELEEACWKNISSIPKLQLCKTVPTHARVGPDD
jgi:hypothetical protein